MTNEQEWNLIIDIVLDEATEEEKQLFQVWLASDPSHPARYDEIRRLCAVGASLPSAGRNWNTGKSWEIAKGRIEKKMNRKRILTRRLSAVAAVVVLLLAVGGWLLFLQETNPSGLAAGPKAILVLGNGERFFIHNDSIHIKQNDIQISTLPGEGLKYDKVFNVRKKAEINRLFIPAGGDYQLVMSDGTKVWLNSESELSYPTYFEGDKREVTLKGEAYFEVSKDTEKPFYVRTDDLSVRVYGTSFNVASYTADRTVKTTLVEGSVSVICGGEEKLLQPSEQLVYEKASSRSEVTVVDTRMYTQWRSGKYYFNNLELEEIMTQIGRWYDLKVVYETKDLRHKRLTGMVYKPNLIGYSLDIISKATDIKLRMKGNTIYVGK